MKDQTGFSQEVGTKAARKIKDVIPTGRLVWFGMMGLIGWSGGSSDTAWCGARYMADDHHAGSHSWTLMLWFIGLVIGFLNAWHWVAKEDKEMQEENNNE